MKQWLTADQPGGIHVVPLGDLIEHECSLACTCAPAVQKLGHTCHGPWGPQLHVRQLITHNAMDNRQ